MKKNHYAVIMAGGVGSRFWPISTTELPKQFHDMLGAGATLLQKTFDRLKSFIPAENILILTNEKYSDLVMEQLPELELNQVVAEPDMRNTAPCILYAAMKIQKMDPDAVMIVAPSDHWIEAENLFAEDVKTCFEKCEKEEVICTMGIVPSFPNTGYGYIEYDKDRGTSEDRDLEMVVQFKEKPIYQTAKKYLEQGNFLGNAGIFMWSTSTIINAFEKYQPSQYQLFNSGMEYYNTEREIEFIQANYPKADNISIDYAILERAEEIYVLPASFDWNDLGTWGSLYDKLDKDSNENALVNASFLGLNSSQNIIRTPAGKLVVIEDLNDYIIVDKEEVLLIMPKSKEQEIKIVLAKVKEIYGDQYT
ncbi:MAG: mannose-1-phosphate guanylyltransferase [Flavobacteriaceae bacterium]